MKPGYRIGSAAKVLGVSVDTVRRWADSGRIRSRRSAGGQRVIPESEVARLAALRRPARAEQTIRAQSARNRFPGVVTRLVTDRVAAQVEVQAGPHRLVALITREAVEELGLEPGTEVVAVVKATSVMVELPQ